MGTNSGNATRATIFLRTNLDWGGSKSFGHSSKRVDLAFAANECIKTKVERTGEGGENLEQSQGTTERFSEFLLKLVSNNKGETHK